MLLVTTSRDRGAYLSGIGLEFTKTATRPEHIMGRSMPKMVFLDGDLSDEMRRAVTAACCRNPNTIFLPVMNLADALRSGVLK